MSYVESLRFNKYGILLMLLSSISVAAGQLFWKISEGVHPIALGLGFLLYGCGALLMIGAFRFGKLSVVHPVLSCSYVFGIVFGFFFLGEEMTLQQYAATGFIFAGVAMIGGGDRE